MLVGSCQWAAPTAFLEEIAGLAAFRDIPAGAESHSKRVFPDGFPGFFKQVAK